MLVFEHICPSRDMSVEPGSTRLDRHEHNGGHSNYLGGWMNVLGPWVCLMLLPCFLFHHLYRLCWFRNRLYFRGFLLCLLPSVWKGQLLLEAGSDW